MIFLKKKPTSRTQLAELIEELVRTDLVVEKWIVTYYDDDEKKHKTKATKVMIPNFDGMKKKKEIKK